MKMWPLWTHFVRTGPILRRAMAGFNSAVDISG